LFLDSREACQLGSIAKDSAIDRGISTCLNGAFTLWKKVLLAVKKKYPFKEDLIYEVNRWTTMEKCIHYLKELVMVEMLYNPTFIHPHI